MILPDLVCGIVYFVFNFKVLLNNQYFLKPFRKSSCHWAVALQF